MFGVSPAFVVSLYGPDFTVSDFCDALDKVKALGFGAYQPEIFTRAGLDEWANGGAKKVSEKAQQLELKPTQFVAHFMHAYFATPQQVMSDSGIDELKRVVELVAEFPGCDVVTIPTLPFEVDWQAVSADEYDQLEAALIDKLQKYLAVITRAGLKMAFEIVPFSIIGSIDRLLRICDKIDSPDIGVNLDTGHAWATRDMIPSLPFKLREKIFGLHLKDNNSDNNLPLAPGKGTIDWKALLANLKKINYAGSLDIEIGCDAEKVEQEYQNGLEYIKSCVR